MIYKVLFLYYLHCYYLIFSASTCCCFPSGISLKIVAFQLEASWCCCVYSRQRKLAASGRTWQCFSRLPSHHFSTCFNDHVRIPSGVHCLMYPDQDPFDFSQGHVTKNQQMAVPVQLSESLGIEHFMMKTTDRREKMYISMP